MSGSGSTSARGRGRRAGGADTLDVAVLGAAPAAVRRRALRSWLTTHGVAGLTDYCASKWAAVGFDEALHGLMREGETEPGFGVDLDGIFGGSGVGPGDGEGR